MPVVVNYGVSYVRQKLGASGLVLTRSGARMTAMMMGQQCVHVNHMSPPLASEPVACSVVSPSLAFAYNYQENLPPRLRCGFC